ncbi:MAG: hypothetical protein ACREN6_00155, partial [Gemmatimonadaceae bacterium]
MSYSGGQLQVTGSDALDSLRTGSPPAPPLIQTWTWTLAHYDSAGNQIASDTYAQRWISTDNYGYDTFDTAPTGQSFVRSYYDEGGRLRVSQRSYFF